MLIEKLVDPGQGDEPDRIALAQQLVGGAAEHEKLRFLQQPRGTANRRRADEPVPRRAENEDWPIHGAKHPRRQPGHRPIGGIEPPPGGRAEIVSGLPRLPPKLTGLAVMTRGEKGLPTQSRRRRPLIPAPGTPPRQPQPAPPAPD